MTGHDEDPTAQAAAKLGQAVALLAAAAEAFAQLQATRTSERAARDERTAAAARTQLRARHSADRLVWSPLLDDRRLAQLDVPDTLAGWGPPGAGRRTRRRRPPGAPLSSASPTCDPR